MGSVTSCILLAGLSVGNLGIRLFSPACGAAGTANTPGRVAPKKRPLDTWIEVVVLSGG